MIPIHDKNPVRRPSVVTWGLIVVNVGIFLASPVAFAGPDPDARTRTLETAYLYHYGAIPKAILSTHGNPLWPAFTAVFVHAGWIHLLGNMLFLYIFGNNVEDAFGRLHFLVFYLLGGAASTYAFALSTPNALTPLVGASGAIAAVLGAYVYLFPQARITLLLPFLWFLPLRVPAWLMLGFWFVMQLPEFQQTIGVMSSSDVAYFAHVSGFLLGLLYTALFVGRGTPRGPLQETLPQTGALPPITPDYRTADPNDPYGTYHP